MLRVIPRTASFKNPIQPDDGHEDEVDNDEWQWWLIAPYSEDFHLILNLNKNQK